MNNSGSTATTPFNFGDIVMDKSSGYSGSVINFVHELNGNLRVGIQPACEEGKENTLPDAMSIDASSLILVKPAEDPMTVPLVETDILVGMEVEDIVTGIRGIATWKMESMSGCVHFSVQPPASKKDQKKGRCPPARLSSAQTLIAISQGVLKDEVFTKQVAAQGPSGGPSTRISHQRAMR